MADVHDEKHDPCGSPFLGCSNAHSVEHDTGLAVLDDFRVRDEQVGELGLVIQCSIKNRLSTHLLDFVCLGSEDNRGDDVVGMD